MTAAVTLDLDDDRTAWPVARATRRLDFRQRILRFPTPAAISTLLMDVTCDGKWFWVDPPTASIAAAAERILDARLAEVQRYLPLAAQQNAEDIEYVHQLRVNCRRAAAALRAFTPLAGRRSLKLKRWLQQIRRAAGPARDADVYLTRLSLELDPGNEHAQRLLDTVQQSRVEAQSGLIEVDRKASQGGFQRAIDRCLDRVARPRGAWEHQSFADFARHALTEAADGLNVINPQTAPLAELHELRIAGKRLRYAIEIFHSAAATSLRRDIYSDIEELQERLGTLNDHLASQARLQQWMALLPADGFSAFLAELIVAEHASAERVRQTFLPWWTSEKQREVALALTASLDLRNQREARAAGDVGLESS